MGVGADGIGAFPSPVLDLMRGRSAHVCSFDLTLSHSCPVPTSFFNFPSQDQLTRLDSPVQTIMSTKEAISPATSVESLVDTIASGQSDLQESALKLLAQKCIEARKALYAAEFVPTLSEAAKAGSTYFSQLYAFECASWAVDGGALTKEEALELRSEVREPSLHELAKLATSLEEGTEPGKDDAALLCCCLGTMTAFAHFSQFNDKIIPRLSDLLAAKSDLQKLWAVYALSNLAACEQYRKAVVYEGTIARCVALARNGTEGQKQWAAIALGNMADDAGVQWDITNEGGLPALIALARSGTDEQKWAAAYALSALGLFEDNRPKIARKDGIPPLVSLVKSDNEKQRRWASSALGNIAFGNDANREAIVKEGAIPALVAMVQSGTDDEKQWAAYALGNLASSSSAVKDAIHKADVATVLAGLDSSDSEEVKKAAKMALSQVRKHGKVRQFLSGLGIF